MGGYRTYVVAEACKGFVRVGVIGRGQGGSPKRGGLRAYNAPVHYPA